MQEESLLFYIYLTSISATMDISLSPSTSSSLPSTSSACSPSLTSSYSPFLCGCFSNILYVASSSETFRVWLWLSSLVFKSRPFFLLLSVGVVVVRAGGRPDVRVMSGGVIINIRSCRETKGPKWKGLAGWGDLAMSCTSVIFLVRLELSQGFNWNPDFKETLGPSSSPPPQLHPCTNSPGWIHSRPQHIHTDRDHYNIRESITMHNLGWNWLCSYLLKIFRCGVRLYVWICTVLVCVWICTDQFFLHFIKVTYSFEVLACS